MKPRTACTARTGSSPWRTRSGACRPWSWLTSRSSEAASEDSRASSTTPVKSPAKSPDPARLDASGTARCASASPPRTAPWWATRESRPRPSCPPIRSTPCGRERSEPVCRRRPLSTPTAGRLFPEGLRLSSRHPHVSSRHPRVSPGTPSRSWCCTRCTRNSWISPCSGRWARGRWSSRRMGTSSPRVSRSTKG